MKIDIDTLTPDDDGITHINAASKGRTKLGKDLSNFANYPIEHTKHGHFDSLEGMWYWLLSNQQFDELRTVSGYPAKQLGESLMEGKEFVIDESTFKEDILEGLRCKLRQHKKLLKMLVDTNLPITHYNWYGKNGKYKIYYYEDYKWFTDEIERIRQVCQEKWKNK
jgi:hypothetical protein